MQLQMDISTDSALSSPSEIDDDVEMQNELGCASSEAPTSKSASPSIRSRPTGRPNSLSSSFIGYKFRSDGVEYTVVEKSAVQKGSRPSYIWRFSSELKTTRQRHPSWLCNICWDKGISQVYSASNTTRPGRHLAQKHRIQSNGELEEISETTTSSMAKSVLQQQHDAASQRPSQVTIDNIIRALFSGSF